ncbi:MAG TPA: glycosyltransferase family 9 protein [Chryseosolibacter sp.]
MKKRNERKMQSVYRIAIFRALYLGDMLCIIPAVRAIRKAFPHAEITLIGLPWQEGFRDRFSKYLDRFISFPGWPGLPEQPLNSQATVEFLLSIRSLRFDLVFQMQGDGDITNSMCMLWNAKKVCGLRKAGGYGPDEALFPVSEDGEHEILRFLKLTRAAGIPDDGSHLEFPITGEERCRYWQIAEGAGLSPNGYVCVHAGARDIRRRWSVDKFAFIASRIALQGYSIVLTGSQDEEDLLSRLQRQIETPVLNIVESFGHLGAGELAAIIESAALLVSNDTGVSHLSAALGTRSVILFSPHSDISRWRPLDRERHISVPFEKAADEQWVLQLVLQQLAIGAPLQPRFT